MTPDHVAKLRAEFARRDADPRLKHRYAAPDESLDRRITALLEELKPTTLLDVGCGSGDLLARLGKAETTLVGVDLSPTRLEEAQRRNPGGSFAIADGAALPFPDGSFDLVCQSTVVSSLLTDGARYWFAAELARVGRAILWYDFIWNPLNPRTRGVGERELRALFPGFRVSVERVTLAPPIARAIKPVAPLLGRIPVLRSHLLGLLTRF